MTTLDEFRSMLQLLDQEKLSVLCEQFVYDHAGAMAATIEISKAKGLSLDKDTVKEFITEMHENGEFDDVECWGIKLGHNDTYKKFHS